MRSAAAAETCARVLPSRHPQSARERRLVGGAAHSHLQWAADSAGHSGPTQLPFRWVDGLIYALSTKSSIYYGVIRLCTCMTRLSFGRRSVSRRAHESRKRESVWEAAGVSITTTTSRGCGCMPKPPLPEACCSDSVAVADEEFAGAELE